jgi:serine/threonine protein kinase
MMALKAPFSGNNPLFIAKNIVNGEYTIELPEQYSPELKNFVKLCLQKDETQRPDARELLKLTVDRLAVFMDELR